MFQTILSCVATTLLLASSAFAHPDAAHVDVEGAWVRATVAGQSGTGGFMKLTAHEDLRLVGLTTPVAAIAEVHEMKMGANNVMEMRAVSGLGLPKGKAVELKPGGYHLMLMNLKQPLAKGSTVPVTLLFQDAKGTQSRLQVTLPVELAPVQGTGAKPAQHRHAH
ncbi:MAG: copper chaperone PCu(A)C [Cytophagales bacterium]|nr:copper chaperone PCu(A)C [Cytophagales bacterium]